MVVSFSGIDGSGKTTQINFLCSYCEERGIRYIKKWSKARGTPGIEFLKRLVRKDKGMSKDAKLEHREEVYRTGWKKHLLYVFSMLDLCWYWGVYYRWVRRKYDLMILDRYIWDTYVEVSSEFNIDKLEKKFLWKLVKNMAVVPDISILLVIPAEESLRRDTLKGELTTESLSFKQRKINIYMKFMGQGCWNTVLDSMKTVAETHSDILLSLKYK